MRKVLAILVPVVLVGLGLIALIPLTSGALGPCQTALLHGTLAARDGVLVVESADGTETVHVRWPFGYMPGDDGGRLGLWHFVTVIAHEGDRVEMGGGTGVDEVFNACGPVTVTFVAPTIEPQPIPPPGSAGPQG